VATVGLDRWINQFGAERAQTAEGDVVSLDYGFPKPGTKQPATKQSLEMRIGNQACGVSYFK
jgi:hypothetical protein